MVEYDWGAQADHWKLNTTNREQVLVNNGLLKQDYQRELDRLVQLIESPMLVGMRLKLLDPARHPALCKCLYGILTLLPQSKAFATLHGRLSSIPSDKLIRLNDLIGHGDAAAEKSKTSKGISFGSGKSKSKEDHSNLQVIHFDRLLHVFYTCQQKHASLHKQTT